jgi:hypothetical protein
MEQHHDSSFVKATEYPVYIASYLYADLVDTVCPFDNPKELRRDYSLCLYQFKNFIDFVSDLEGLGDIKFLVVILKQFNVTNLLHANSSAKLTN